MVAIVAVAFLGIRERLDAVGAIAERVDAMLIEDCAQWYPEPATALVADAVVLSFGRGKPVNLLGGGGLLLRDSGRTVGCGDPGSAVEPGRVVGTVSFGVRARIFDGLLDPVPYGLLRRIPALRLGETRFKSLQGIHELDPIRRGLLASHVRSWLAHDRWRERALCETLSAQPELWVLPRALSERAGRLLRLPVLFPDKESRDRALRKLEADGLGGSAFYRLPLPRVADAPPCVAGQGPFAASKCFADRLLTLPIHARVGNVHVEAMIERIQAVFA